MRKEITKIANIIVLTAFYGCCIYLIYREAILDDTLSLLNVIMTMALPILPWLIMKLLRIQKSAYEIYIIFNLFLFIANILGTNFEFYIIIPYYDKYLHTISGFLMAVLGLMLYSWICKLYNQNPKDNKVMLYTFIILFVLATAVLWEISEYFYYLITDLDVQHHLDTGVHDTMQDMIVAFVGGLFELIFVWLYFEKKKVSLLLGIYASFYKDEFKDG